MSTPPTPKNPGQLVGFMYVTQRPDGLLDIETGHAAPDKDTRRKLFAAMINALETELARDH